MPLPKPDFSEQTLAVHAGIHSLSHGLLFLFPAQKGQGEEKPLWKNKIRAKKESRLFNWKE